MRSRIYWSRTSAKPTIQRDALTSQLGTTLVFSKMLWSSSKLGLKNDEMCFSSKLKATSPISSSILLSFMKSLMTSTKRSTKWWASNSTMLNLSISSLETCLILEGRSPQAILRDSGGPILKYCPKRAWLSRWPWKLSKPCLRKAAQSERSSLSSTTMLNRRYLMASLTFRAQMLRQLSLAGKKFQRLLQDAHIASAY